MDVGMVVATALAMAMDTDADMVVTTADTTDIPVSCSS